MMKSADIQTGPARDSFIPYLLDDLLEMCLSDGPLSPEEGGAFREFASFFSACGNFRSHRELGSLDKDYAYFNPDSEMRLAACSPQDLAAAGGRVVAAFRTVALGANYREMTREEMIKSFESMCLIKMKTAVDLDEFDQVECFVRGNDLRTHKVRNWKLQEVKTEIEVWRRVLLLMKFKKDEDLTEIQLKRRRKAKLPCQAGRIYLYQYKEVPKADLEILFPNVRVSMNLKDRIMIGVPALVAAVLTTLKVGIKIAFVAGVIAWVFFGKQMFDFDPQNGNDAMKVAVTVLGLLVAFGGLVFKQYLSVKNKRITFLKEVTEHLFFRNIAMNKAVLTRIIEDAEGEDCKEALLVYYHLLIHRGAPLNRMQLDEKIQQWMSDKFNTLIDFDINGPIEKLKQFTGQTNLGESMALLTEDVDGGLHIPSLKEAGEIMDYYWDTAFSHRK